MPAFCVDVKPRKSSEVSGIRSAPGICAACASCFGSERPPSKPPPAKPRRIDVSLKSFGRADPLLGVVDVRAGRRERSRIARSFCSSTRIRRVAREALGVEQRRLVGAAVVRQQALRCAGDEPLEVRRPHATVTPSPAATARSRPRAWRARARATRCASRRSARLDGQARGQRRVVERRHEHLDRCPSARPGSPSSRCCSGSVRRRRGAFRRRAGELVDELVDPGCADCAGSAAGDELPAGELHQTAGLISTSDASSCFRYRTTCRWSSGGARCSESV